MFWRIFTHHTLKTLLRIGQVIVFVVIPAVLLWLQFVGLPRAFSAPLIEAAAREKLSLEFQRMRLSLLEGLVLDKVRLHAEQDLQNPDVAVDRAAVSLNWSKLLRGRVELTGIDLRGAELFLPIAATDGVVQTLRLTKARARLILSQGVVSVPFAQFNLQGIEVQASGQVALATEGAKAPQGQLPTEVARALEFIESLDFGESPPQLEVEFSARAGELAALSLSRIRFEAAEVDYHAIRLLNVALDADFSGEVLTTHRLTLRDPNGGAADISGQWNLATGAGRAEWISSLAPAPWLAELTSDGPWGELEFVNPPQLEGSLSLLPGGALQVLGTIVTGPFSMRGTEFGGLGGGFAWRDGSLYASDVIISLPGGELRMDMMLRPDDVRLRIDCRADPQPLAAFLGERDREGIAKMNLEFLEPPHIQIEASGTKLDPAMMTASGTLKLGHTAIHGSPMDGATANITFADLALTLSDIRVSRPEGTGSGAFVYDFGRQQVRLEGIRSTMSPFNVLQWADPNVARETRPYLFKAPPEVTVSGVIGLKDPTQTRLVANFTAPQGLAYDLLERTLNFGRTTGSLEFTGRRILVNIPSAELFGGSAKVTADITTGQPGAAQKIGINLHEVDFAALTRLYFDYRGSQGELSGHYDFSFVPENPASMRGTGHMLVKDGNVFAIPVLGPLSMALDAVIPGTGYQTARKATCDFHVANGEIRTDNLDIVGRGFSIIGQGSLFFLKDRMNFHVRVNAQGVPGLILYPVSKLFEYVSDGKMSDPQWRPKVLPKGSGEHTPRHLQKKHSDSKPDHKPES